MFAPAFMIAVTVTTPPLACINTTYSRADEEAITDSLGHLIVGAFAHHGEAFYRSEVARCQAILAEAPDDFDARNDLGAALTKLGDWNAARSAFEENERRHPGRYETASNLGVMYKKQGDFKKAAEWIEKALSIKPGGHMGLGDYYLKMLVWKEQQKSDDQPKENFLGVSYGLGPQATIAAANREYLVNLIKNDYSFADAYVALGDVLFQEQEYQLAIRAYYRALNLNHRSSYVYGRIEAIILVWKSQNRPGYVIEHDHGDQQIYEEFETAAAWLDSYQALETERIHDGQAVDFEAMKLAMAEQGIEKPRLLHAVHYRGSAHEAAGGYYWASFGRFLAILFGGGVLLAAVTLAILISLRTFNRNKPSKPYV